MSSVTRGFCPAGATTRGPVLSAGKAPTCEPGNRRPSKSPTQFRRRLRDAVIIGNAAQARPGLITRILDRLQVFEDAFFRRCDRPDVEWRRGGHAIASSAGMVELLADLSIEGGAL
jgi:hypothetical protein